MGYYSYLLKIIVYSVLLDFIFYSYLFTYLPITYLNTQVIKIIGIPLGLFGAVIFIFSLLFGHLIAVLLMVYYLKYKKEKDWGFWSISYLALLCAAVLRLLTIIPFAGILISVAILSITYGALL